MKYGHFDDNNKEYVINSMHTPLPWINYLGNKDFFTLISNLGGGYSFYKDAKLLRLTRYRYNNVPNDIDGKHYYIVDGDTVFNPTYMPTQTTLDKYECRHGLGYTKFMAVKEDLAVDTLSFVPLNDPCEINIVTLTNNSDVQKNVKLYSSLEWCLYNAVDDSTNYQRNLNIGEVEVENNVIYHKTEYRERRNHFAFFGVNEKINSFDTDRETFLGLLNGFNNPVAIKNGNCSNSIASGWSPIAAHQLDCSLEPGESKSFVFILGFIENEEDKKFIAPNVINKEKAYKLLEKYSTKEKALAEFKLLNEYWDKLLGIYSITSNNDKVNRMVNIWHQYQCMVTFNMSRSASYFESGTGRGMGFRDSCQDILGFVHLIPDRSRQRILDIASIQFSDGSTYHQYQPLTKRGNADIGGGFNDDPLWLIACTAAYLKETGDQSILFENTPFNNDMSIAAPLHIHLKKSIEFTLNNLGPHGLPLIGRADWNDCLNLACFSKTPGESFQTIENKENRIAESVFIGGMFVLYAREYAHICKNYLQNGEEKTILKEVDKMEQAILKYGWDGNHYLRAYDAFGHKVGSKENEEGKIYIEPQGFCGMALVGGKDTVKIALEDVEAHLACDYGYELLNPPYSTYQVELGEISSYPPGYKENGSVFCHNNPWIVCAYSAVGDGEHAFNAYKKTCPAYLEDISDIHKTEPYVYSQTIAGRQAQNYGLAKNSWLTGTASWSFVAISQAILGIVPDYNGLKISPALPSELDNIKITRIFRGTKYNISISHGDVPSIKINGKISKTNIIPLSDDEVKVEVIIK